MKLESWKFLVAIDSEPKVRRELVGAVLDKVGHFMRNSSGEYYALSGDAARTLIVQSREDLVQLFLNESSAGVQVHVAPEGWPFYVWFVLESPVSNTISQNPYEKPETIWFEIRVSTGALWQDASAQERSAWETSFDFLAENVIRSTHPIWGVRMHEWDWEYVMDMDSTLLDYELELRHGHLPRLLGPITYLNRDLLRRAPLERVENLQVGPIIDNLGSLIFVSSEHWPQAMVAWLKAVERS